MRTHTNLIVFLNAQLFPGISRVVVPDSQQAHKHLQFTTHLSFVVSLGCDILFNIFATNLDFHNANTACDENQDLMREATPCLETHRKHHELQTILRQHPNIGVADQSRTSCSRAIP